MDLNRHFAERGDRSLVSYISVSIKRITAMEKTGLDIREQIL